jgi:Mg-chelatase subunit ChlD
MSTIIIKTDKKSSKILAELARKLGGNVFDMKDNQFEELMLGNLMDKVKTGKTVSKESILKKLRS